MYGEIEGVMVVRCSQWPFYKASNNLFAAAVVEVGLSRSVVVAIACSRALRPRARHRAPAHTYLLISYNLARYWRSDPARAQNRIILGSARPTHPGLLHTNEGAPAFLP